MPFICAQINHDQSYSQAKHPVEKNIILVELEVDGNS
jgi:hypothetical protein